MTSTELWMQHWHNWMDDKLMKRLGLASCILHPYFQDSMMYEAFGETVPYPWKTIRRKWRVFGDAKQPRR